MVDTRDSLKEEYRDLVLNRGQGRDKFVAKCLKFLAGHFTTDCFKLLPLNVVFHDFQETAKWKGDEEFPALVKIFELFEKYAASIAAKPWCKEFHTIKVYTGFFKYNFEQWLSSKVVYQVFNLIGYERKSSDTLTLQTPADEKQSLTIGFELCLAHSQLFLIEHTEFISSKYRIDRILEGWLNTTGNVVDILQWLVKNMPTVNKGPEFDRSVLSRVDDISDETANSSSVYVHIESSYDKNGRFMIEPNNHPRKFDIDESYETNSNYRSLPPLNLTDSQLYGNDDDHDTSPQQNKRSQDECVDPNTLVTEPFAFTNRSYEHVNVVARGGNSQGDSSHIYTNVNDRDLPVTKERIEQILYDRRNSNLVGRGTEGGYKTRAQEICGIRNEHYLKNVETGNSRSQQPLRRNTWLDAAGSSEVTDNRPLCMMCSQPAIIGCKNCPIIVCSDDKCSILLKKQKCIGEGAHKVYYMTSGEEPKSREDFVLTQYQHFIQEPSSNHMLPNLTSGSEAMDWLHSCTNCGKPACYGCNNCDVLICEDCFKKEFEADICGGKPHEFRYFSNV